MSHASALYIVAMAELCKHNPYSLETILASNKHTNKHFCKRMKLLSSAHQEFWNRVQSLCTAELPGVVLQMAETKKLGVFVCDRTRKVGVFKKTKHKRGKITWTSNVARSRVESMCRALNCIRLLHNHKYGRVAAPTDKIEDQKKNVAILKKQFGKIGKLLC
jgi:hypothetical protein